MPWSLAQRAALAASSDSVPPVFGSMMMKSCQTILACPVLTKLATISGSRQR